MLNLNFSLLQHSLAESVRVKWKGRVFLGDCATFDERTRTVSRPREGSRPQRPQGSPIENVAAGIWALPVWGGGLNPCPDGLWHLFLGEMS